MNISILSGGLIPLDDPVFKFDPNRTTFTPSMAKRATSVFAAAPIVQGTPLVGGASDSLSFPLSTQVSNYFYTTLDENQGSIVMWITPEAIGLAYQYLFWFSGNFNAYIGTSYLCFKTNAGTVSATHGFTAGSTYCIVLRWDLKNTIDGTNYMSISINDVHTFGATTSAAATALLAGGFIGTKSSTDTAANAIIQGLTIYRRVLFDGTYGQDVGNGDEINLIYNSGTGKDPTLVTGSWDVTFCLPTDATAGALTTGAGNAWSHPHSSNVLKHWLLEDRYYGGGAWGVAFGGTTGRINCGSNASIDDLPASAFTAEGWFLSTASATQYLLSKRAVAGTDGWTVYLTTSNINARIKCATTDAEATYNTSISGDGKWHHIAVTYDDTGDKRVRLFLDGVLVNTSSAGVGAYVSDAAGSFTIGTTTSSLTGSVGWMRLSNSIRYSANFVPPRTLPVADANTVEQWSLSEGTGTTAAATVNAANNGTITAGTWESQWQPVGTPVIPYSVEFNGTSTQIDCGSDAGFLDISDNAFTVEFWQRSDTKGTSTEGGFIEKMFQTNGWFVKWRGTGGIEAQVRCATTDAVSRTGSTIITSDGRWHHVAVTWDDAGDRKLRIFIDGNQPSTYTLQTAGVGAIKTDTGINLKIGHDGSGKYHDGGMGWVRISNSVRYTTNFIPTSRIAPPTPDANTIAQWNMTEGAGTTIDNAEGTAARDGTLSNGTWNITPDMATDSPGGRTYNWGYVIGSDAANEGVKQVLTGLTAGANYVLRVPVYMGRTGMSQPYVMIYDETNGAEITRINGDWSRERVVNGGFDSDVSWGKGVGCTIAGGVAHWDGSQVAESDLTQGTSQFGNGGVTPGRLYKLTYTIANYGGGSIQPWLCSSGGGITRSANGTTSEFIRAAGSSVYILFAANADFVGDIDNVSVTPISEESKPDILMCSFELPTVARNGVAADCTSISIQLLNAATGGVCGWQQGELLPNLLDNSSMDAISGDPGIPAGWTNYNLDAGDSEDETSVTHSTGHSLQYNAGASGEGVLQTFALTVGKFYTLGGFLWSDGVTNNIKLSDINGKLVKQSTSATAVEMGVTSALWTHVTTVGRFSSAGTVSCYVRATGAGSANRYADDNYLIVLDDVTLTVTPASLANSTESTGIRVDGRDSLAHSIPSGTLFATKGKIKFKYTPRHSAADVAKFGNSVNTIFYLYPNASNYIILDWSAANTMRLRCNAGGVGVESATWEPGSAIVAGTTYTLQIEYTSGKITVKVDGTTRLTINQPISFSVPFVTAYFGSDSTPAYQDDATFDKP